MSDVLDSTSYDRAQSNVRLAQSIANRQYKANPNRAPLGDFLSWAMHGLIKAAKKFDPDRGLKFSTLATYKINFEILSGIRDRAKAMNKYDSYEEITENSKRQFSDDCRYEAEHEAEIAEVSEAIHKALRILSTTERDIIEMYDFKGMSQTEIGKKYHRDPSWVSVKRKEAKKKLREYLESWYENWR